MNCGKRIETGSGYKFVLGNGYVGVEYGNCAGTGMN